MNKLVNPVPYNGTVFVKDAPKEDAVETKLILTPEMSQIVPKYGEVIKIQDEVSEKTGVEVGDLVIYSPHVGTMINLNSEEVRIISVPDILGIQK